MSVRLTYLRHKAQDEYDKWRVLQSSPERLKAMQLTAHEAQLTAQYHKGQLDALKDAARDVAMTPRGLT